MRERGREREKRGEREGEREREQEGREGGENEVGLSYHFHFNTLIWIDAFSQV